MQATSSIALTDHIASVPLVGRKRAEEFLHLGIRSVSDLLLYKPTRYEMEHPEQTIAEVDRLIGPVHHAEANVAIRGEVLNFMPPYGKKPARAQVADETGTVELLWFHSPWMKGRLHAGERIIVTGPAKRHGDAIQFINPTWENEAEEASLPARVERLVPVYRASDKLPSKVIHEAVESILDEALALIEDHLTEEYRREKALPTLSNAYRMLHRPKDEDEIGAAQRRLAFDDLFMLQLGVMMKHYQRRLRYRAPKLKHNKKIDQHICARFPFVLTQGQNDVIKDLIEDLTRENPMNRLLQGDVGSGKTVVAVYAMLMAVASKHQAALMAPTELLAEQHFSSITSLLKDSRVSIELLTGSLKPVDRKRLIARVESGEVDILIGTHALLTESVKFKSLAVIVIDEQHRFGVHQRATLRAKATDPQSIPHTLVMTATPIPRTLSLTVFGDLDSSIITDMPPGRQPVATRQAPQSKAHEAYKFVAKRIAQGEQAFIVVPVIDETETNLKDVHSYLKQLEARPLKGKRLAAMHGRLKRETREKIMYRFRKGEIDALIATTVIEVGVDIPNASVMVIEHAERFGLAQLHQLRGRVGRGERKSVCILIADPANFDAEARINALVSTNDGFEIAEKDLEIRGPGELFGTDQSGAMPLRFAELPKDIELLQMARRDAKQWIENDPMLAKPKHTLLRTRLLKAYGKTLGLADVA